MLVCSAQVIATIRAVVPIFLRLWHLGPELQKWKNIFYWSTESVTRNLTISWRPLCLYFLRL